MRVPPQSEHCHAKILVLITACLFSVSIGCEKPKPIIKKFQPPLTITAKNLEWSLLETGVSETDNQKIDRFFKNRPDLLGSPEWDGQPEKYVCDKSSKRTRLYWFSGSLERPAWNGLEFNGPSMSLFSGIGNPDDS